MGAAQIIRNIRAHTKRVTPRNNSLCQLIDQITSRWNTLPNSDHHTHRLPLRNGAFLFVQSHPRRSFHLASPRHTPLPHIAPCGDIRVVKSRERHFLFHLRRGIVACGIINNRLRWFLRGLTRRRKRENRIYFIARLVRFPGRKRKVYV